MSILLRDLNAHVDNRLLKTCLVGTVCTGEMEVEKELFIERIGAWKLLFQEDYTLLPYMMYWFMIFCYSRSVLLIFFQFTITTYSHTRFIKLATRVRLFSANIVQSQFPDASVPSSHN